MIKLALLLWINFGMAYIAAIIASFFALPSTSGMMAWRIFDPSLPFVQRTYRALAKTAILLLMQMELGKPYFSRQGEGPYGPQPSKSRRKVYRSQNVFSHGFHTPSL
jgi:hypothetical protein